jgi:hypothetical protein
MFYSDTFPQIIQSLWLSKGKLLSGFAIGQPGQRRGRVPLLVRNDCPSLPALNNKATDKQEVSDSCADKQVNSERMSQNRGSYVLREIGTDQ